MGNRIVRMGHGASGTTLPLDQGLVQSISSWNSITMAMPTSLFASWMAALALGPRITRITNRSRLVVSTTSLSNLHQISGMTTELLVTAHRIRRTFTVTRRVLALM